MNGILDALRRAGWAGNQSVGLELYAVEKGISELLCEIDALVRMHKANYDLAAQVEKLEALAVKARKFD